MYPKPGTIRDVCWIYLFVPTHLVRLLCSSKQAGGVRVDCIYKLGGAVYISPISYHIICNNILGPPPISLTFLSYFFFIYLHRLTLHYTMQLLRSISIVAGVLSAVAGALPTADIRDLTKCDLSKAVLPESDGKLTTTINAQPTN